MSTTEPEEEHVLFLGPWLTLADLPGMCDRLREIVRDGVVVCDAAAVTEPDAVTLEILVRLRLAARRLGCGIRIERPGHDLRALLALSGFDTLFVVSP